MNQFDYDPSKKEITPHWFIKLLSWIWRYSKVTGFVVICLCLICIGFFPFLIGGTTFLLVKSAAIGYKVTGKLLDKMLD